MLISGPQRHHESDSSRIRDTVEPPRVARVKYDGAEYIVEWFTRGKKHSLLKETMIVCSRTMSYVENNSVVLSEYCNKDNIL